MPSFFSAGFGGNARRTAARGEIKKKSSEFKRQQQQQQEHQSPADEKSSSSTPTSDDLEGEGSLVIRHDNRGRPFWWHARTGQWAYLAHYVHGSATPSAAGYNYLPLHENQCQHYQQPPLMCPPHAAGYPISPPRGGPGFYAGNATVSTPLWVVSPSTSPVVVPIVPAERAASLQRTGEAGAAWAVRSEGAKSNRAQEQDKQGSERKPWGPTWEKFYGEDGRAVWIHSVSGKLRKTDPYV